MPERKILIHSNLDKMLEELTTFLDDKSNSCPRIGTGEFMDSMVLKELDDVNRDIISIIKKRPNAVMEFKTKSSRIAPFLEQPGSPNIVLSWSLNPQWIIDKEEKGTATLEQRLNVAKEAQRNGYSLAFHFDPIFMRDDTLKDYSELVGTIFEHVRPDSVKWFSLGGFRYTEELKYAILKKSGGAKWFLGEEYVRCSDGKYRFPKTLRLKFYNHLGKLIKDHGVAKVYMCMEEGSIWSRIQWQKELP
jgi:spore photoproduct lyase